MMLPLVSVILPVFNGEKTILRAIESILNQSYENFELIICNDASVDKTQELLKLFETHPKVKVMTNSLNLGRAASRNRMIAVSSGKYIAFQDADDYSLKDRLQKQVTLLEENANIDVVSSWADLIDEDGCVWGNLKTPQKPLDLNWIIAAQNVHAASMVRAEKLRFVGGYDESIRRAEDYHMWMKMVQKGYQFFNLQESLYVIQWGAEDYGRRSAKERFLEFSVKIKACWMLGAGLRYFFAALKPLVLICIPRWIQFKLHSLRFKKKSQ